MWDGSNGDLDFVVARVVLAPSCRGGIIVTAGAPAARTTGPQDHANVTCHPRV